MNIGIDIRSTLKRTRTGIGRYTISLINALAEIDTDNDYYLYSKKKILDFKRRLPGLPAKNFHHCVNYFRKDPARALPDDIDVFQTSSYDLQCPRGARFIVTVHDVIHKAYPYGHDRHTIEEMEGKFKKVLSSADVLVAVSYSTKSDLMKFYKVSDSKIAVIYLGVNPLFEAKPKTTDSDMVLFVGTLEPRKNVGGLIKAFSWLKKEYGIRHKLYIVGMKGWMYESIFKAYEESKFKNDIVIKGYVGEKKLRELYLKASVFVYPSFYEGFGFPIIEAFSSGVPVVTSRTSSCGEIAGDSALLVDPSDYKEIGRAILELIRNRDLRKELIRKGINRAKEFTWTKTAGEFVKLFTY